MARPWATRPPEQVRAAVILGGLLLASLGVWVVGVTVSDERPSERLDPGQSVADPSVANEQDGDGTAESGSDETDPEAGERDEGATSTIDFDGACTIEVELADIDDPDALRPWQFPECERASVDLTGPVTRWIVVVESMPGETFTESDALVRLDGHDQADQLLWSSHYPSLNPGFWVAFDGPFHTETAAAEAAERIGGASYPRLLSDREDDR